MDEHRHKKGIRTALVILAIFIPVAVCSLLYLRGDLFLGMGFNRQGEAEGEMQNQTVEAGSMGDAMEEDEETQADESSINRQEEYETSHKEEKEETPEQEPLTASPVKLSDAYVEKGSVASLKSYYPDATGYTWEVRDMENGKWLQVPEEDIAQTTDELYRPVSIYMAEVYAEKGEYDIRCTASLEGGEMITDTATLHPLEKIKSISADEYTGKAGEYISARQIPVNVTYENGRQETVTGLNGLYFLEKEESSKPGTDTVSSDNMTEVITTVIMSKEYCYLEGEKTCTLRYHAGEEAIDVPVRIVGKDTMAPQITDLSVGSFENSAVDEPVAVTISITAEDDVTAYSDLVYAFLPEGEKPQEEDWTGEASFTMDITKNGIWNAYCRDESGNVASKEQEMIVVDNKAPNVSLSLENDTWCTENKIIVNAKDAQPVEYCYSCIETEEDSGWIDKNEHITKKNGTWIVKVRDASGNETELEIVIDNIDNKPPVIHAIRKKTEGEGETISND